MTPIDFGANPFDQPKKRDRQGERVRETIQLGNKENPSKKKGKTDVNMTSMEVPPMEVFRSISFLLQLDNMARVFIMERLI